MQTERKTKGVMNVCIPLCLSISGSLHSLLFSVLDELDDRMDKRGAADFRTFEQLSLMELSLVFAQ